MEGKGREAREMGVEGKEGSLFGKKGRGGQRALVVHNLCNLRLENELCNLLENKKSGRLDQHCLSEAPPSIKFQLTT